MHVSRKDYFSTIFTTTFSPCGNYLIVGNNYGHLIIFNITQSLTIDISLDLKVPLVVIPAHTGTIYTITQTSEYLISGGSKEIHGWLWKELLHHKNPKPKWTFTIPSTNPFDSAETNSIIVNEGNNCLIAGCGDNNIYLWDLENGDMKDTLKGHTDYVHCVKYLKQTNQILSGGEDGVVHFWDVRTPKRPVETIEPCKLETASRNSLGTWVSCLAIDATEDWLVCGGSSHLSVWHLRSKTPTAILQTPKSFAQVVAFEDDYILSAGTEPYVYKWSINGDLRTKFPCSPKSVYSLEINKTMNKVLAVSGSSCQIDISTNFDYKAFSFTCKT